LRGLNWFLIKAGVLELHPFSPSRLELPGLDSCASEINKYQTDVLNLVPSRNFFQLLIIKSCVSAPKLRMTFLGRCKIQFQYLSIGGRNLQYQSPFRFSRDYLITSNRSFALSKTAERTCSLGKAVGFMAGMLSAYEPERMPIILGIVFSLEKGTEGFFITRLADRKLWIT